MRPLSFFALLLAACAPKPIVLPYEPPPPAPSPAAAKADPEARAPKTIQTVVRSHFTRFRACYDSALREDPGMRGKLTLRFMIDVGGRVHEARLQEYSVLPGTMIRCVVDEAATMRFPEGGTKSLTVVYPIVFSQAKGDEDEGAASPQAGAPP